MLIKIKNIILKIRPFLRWTTLADEASDTFISLFGHAVAGAGVVVVVVVVVTDFAMAVVAASF